VIFRLPFRTALLIVILLLPAASARAQDRTPLQALIEDDLAGFRGVIGVYARNLATGETVELRADELFPTASMVKVPILAGVFDAIERGELSLEQDLVYRDSLLYPGVDILGLARDSSVIQLGKVVMLMLTRSENKVPLISHFLHPPPPGCPFFI
jgi:beta-lactamase class A